MKEEGEIEEAMASYRIVIELKPGHADAYQHLATCLHEENELQNALIFYASALKLNDKASGSRYHLCAAGVEDLATYFQVLKSEMVRLLQRTEDLHKKIFVSRCISNFSGLHEINLESALDLPQIAIL